MTTVYKNLNLRIYAWSVASITTSYLLIEHIHPSEALAEHAYVLGLCGLANALILFGTGTCLSALGV